MQNNTKRDVIFKNNVSFCSWQLSKKDVTYL